MSQVFEAGSRDAARLCDERWNVIRHSSITPVAGVDRSVPAHPPISLQGALSLTGQTAFQRIDVRHATTPCRAPRNSHRRRHFHAFLAMITPSNGTWVSATTKRIPPSSLCNFLHVIHFSGVLRMGTLHASRRPTKLFAPCFARSSRSALLSPKIVPPARPLLLFPHASP